ncbi:uncharacterized protein OCT59_025403 [Rhizophagus irregularis]|uniref:uncharacterized protein n=1 Tax=Rhizophagus irregularis TaxID=588596 RepID=UPI00333238A5|nr:hypothetical protein OCT59_025403 [Rhizophagus irregularis]
MSTKFLSKLSQNFIELLADDEYYDVTIEVGEDPNVKIFRAHMNILCYRSPYLRRTLASNKKNKDNALAHIKLSNIMSEVFQIILKYIYCGILSLNEQDNSEIFKVLLAADELLIQELVDYLQKYLIENKTEWMEQHFELIHRTSFQSNSLLELQQYCTDFMVKSPEKIFKSLDFTSLSEKSLIQLIKRDDLQMKEIEVWEHVLKWGLAQNPTLNPDPTTCKPTDDILLPRDLKIDGIIDSSIINNLSIISTFSRRIDKIDVSNNFAHLRELYLPYRFQLLLRGSRDGFTPKKFHELCDNKYNTITFIKVKGTEEILEKDIKSVIISNIKNTTSAVFYLNVCGPRFGDDINIYSYNGESKDYNFSNCKKYSYEREIRDTEDQFSIEDYEVFQIIKR